MRDQDDIPEKKNSDALSRCQVSKSSIKQEEISEKRGKKHLSNEELNKFLSKCLKRTLEKAGAIIASPLSPCDKSLMRTDPQNLKEMALAKRLAIQGANSHAETSKEEWQKF